jgi:hypothetical protein
MAQKVGSGVHAVALPTKRVSTKKSSGNSKASDYDSIVKIGYTYVKKNDSRIRTGASHVTSG